MVKENNTISTGTQQFSGMTLLCVTMWVTIDVSREPYTQQGRMLTENKSRICCQEEGGSRWTNLLCTTVPGSLGPKYECWEIALPQQKGSLPCIAIFLGWMKAQENGWAAFCTTKIELKWISLWCSPSGANWVLLGEDLDKWVWREG